MLWWWESEVIMDLSFSDLVFRILAAYAVSFVLADSHLLLPLRTSLIKVFQWNRHLVELTPETGNGRWTFFECRMCIGFWVSLAITLLFGGGVLELLAIYGGSYFLATQER